MAPGCGLHLRNSLILCTLLTLAWHAAAAKGPTIVFPSVNRDLGHTASANASLTLKCEGDRNVTWDYSWMVTTEDGQELVQTTHSVNNGVSTATLEIKKPNFHHVGLYTCRYQSCPNDQGEGCSDSLYLFVKDENNLLTENGVHMLSVKHDENFTIPCKPTFPGVIVTLTGADGTEIPPSSDAVRKGYHCDRQSNPSCSGRLTCSANYTSHHYKVIIIVNNLQSPSKPWITVEGPGVWQRNYDDVTLYDVLEGQAITLTCSNNQKNGEPQWLYNITYREGIEGVNNTNVFDKELKIDKLTQKHGFVYECRTENRYYKSSTVSVNITVVGTPPHMKFLKPSNYSDLNLPKMVDINWIIPFRAYPLPNFTWLHDGEVVLNTSSTETEVKHEKYNMIVDREEGFVLLEITGPTMKDIGHHTLRAVQKPPGTATTYEFDLIVTGGPESVSLVRQPSREAVQNGSSVTITCGALGYPRPNLTLRSQNCTDINNCSEYKAETTLVKNVTCSDDSLAGCRHYLAETKVSWVVIADQSQKYICDANNANGITSSAPLLLPVVDKVSGTSSSDALSFQVNILDDPREFGRSFGGSMNTDFFERYEAIGGQKISFTCQANRMLLYDGKAPKIIVWNNPTCDTATPSTKILKTHPTMDRVSVITDLSVFSNATITISETVKNQTCYAAYSCVVPAAKPSREVKVIIDVLEKIPPKFLPNPSLNAEYHKKVHDNLSLICPATGIPAPQVEWKKDGSLVMNETNHVTVDLDEHTLRFKFLKANDTGKYTCSFVGEVGEEQYTFLTVTDPEAYQKKILTYAVIGITVLLVICSIFIGVKVVRNHKKIRKERDFQRQLFLNGDVDNLNPDLDITEQADLLPYNKKYEFPRDKIVFDKLLGSGAFGRVYRAKAKGILQDEEESTVAVKMIKSRSDHNHLKALRSEIKIMMHIGRHLNIVNLLGACSADMASKGELCLIVEYCRYGNVLTYMRQKKGTFINQVGSDGRIISPKYGSLTSRGSLQRNGYMNFDPNSTVVYRSGKRRRTMSQSKTTSDGQGRPLSRSSNNESPLSPSGQRANPVTNTQNDLGQAFQNSPLRSPTYFNGSVGSPPVHSPRANNSAGQSFTFDTVPEEIGHHSEYSPRESHQIQTPTQDGLSPRRILQSQGSDEQTSLGNGSSSGNGRVRRGSGSNSATSATYQTTQGGGGYPEKPGFLSDMTQFTQDCDSEACIALGEDNLNTQRLLHWCYQIANGMEYLAARKVMHGDLAARNILLAENGVVKISDFGMAKDIYKDDQYTKTSKVPIPIKWMAIEALRDGVYSTQSDVWSFGVVMWEIFSLGQIPYPTIEVNKNFVDQLEAGTRLNRPPYATDDLYGVMKMCWKENPTERPLFDKLAEHLGNMMEETEKQFYLDLNKDNAELWLSNSSILNRMRSPDIRLLNNLDEAGYQLPKNETMEVENSAQSYMSHRNIHGLSIQTSPTDEEAGIEYLPMMTPTRVSEVNEHPPTPGYYTQMSRSATPSRTIRSPMSIRSISTSPTIYEERVFQFPSAADNKFPATAASGYSEKGASIDSGFYTPSLTGNFSNPEYFIAPSVETELMESTPMIHSNGRPPPVLRQLSLKSDFGDQSRDYCNVPLKPSRNRTTSETSSGLRSIHEDPSRESLLQSMGSSHPIPEERHLRHECAV